MGSCYTGSKRSPEHALQTTVEKNSNELKEIKDLLKNGSRGGRGGGGRGGAPAGVRGRGGGRGAGGRGGKGRGHEAGAADPSVLNEKLSRTCSAWNSGEFPVNANNRDHCPDNSRCLLGSVPQREEARL